MTTDRCETCRHCNHLVYYDAGECRRHAPIVANHTLSTYPDANRNHESAPARWPYVVRSKHWCGDYEKKEGEIE